MALNIRKASPKKEIPIERMLKVFRYDPCTGEILTIIDRTNSPKGTSVGSFNKGNGYESLQFEGIGYLKHRVAWALHHREQPTEVDHIDLNKRNNRLSNLRLVTRSENILNNYRHKEN